MKVVVNINGKDFSTFCGKCKFAKLTSDDPIENWTYSCLLFNKELSKENGKNVRCVDCVNSEEDYKKLYDYYHDPRGQDW